MRGRSRLFPITLLAMLAGCGPTSGDSAQATNAVAAPVAVAEVANVVEAPPPAPAPEPVRPSPQVTVRAQPAPLHPLDLPASDGAASAAPFPPEVTNFMVDRDGCDHFRGEEPYDAERRAYLEESIAELCTGSDAKLAMLRRRYAGDPSVVRALSGYEDRIEGVAQP